MIEDSDVSGMWREHHAERSKKREDNRTASPRLLTEAGIQFTAYSESHLRVGEYDFWPGTGLWIHLPTGKRGRGVRKLISKLGQTPTVARQSKQDGAVEPTTQVLEAE